MNPYGRYSIPEYERRFLLDAIPDAVTEPRQITDRFVIGTRLRLRVVWNLDQTEVLSRKLGQKIRPNPSDPTTVMHTTLYVDADELQVFEHLDALEICKIRYQWEVDGFPAAVDSYREHLGGLVLAELNFETAAQLEDYVPGPALGPETTHIASLTGPSLASISRSDLDGLIASLCAT